MKSITINFVIFITLLASSQVFSQESYVVNTDSLNVRTGPSIKFEKLGKLYSGDVVSVLNTENAEWWKISYYGTEGYVASKYLTTVEKSVQYKDWAKENASTGDNPECENITPKYAYELDNELLIHVGKNFDVVVKLMSKYGNCIRIAYIEAGDDFSMKNIPEGIYYLKIAYGKDFRKYSKDGQCIVKFLRDATYEKGTNTLDFYKVKKPNTYEGDYVYENWSLPSFELSLNIEYTKGNSNGFNSFLSNTISEQDFNK